jgi:hypothetical protein
MCTGIYMYTCSEIDHDRRPLMICRLRQTVCVCVHIGSVWGRSLITMLEPHARTTTHPMHTTAALTIEHHLKEIHMIHISEPPSVPAAAPFNLLMYMPYHIMKMCGGMGWV